MHLCDWGQILIYYLIYDLIYDLIYYCLLPARGEAEDERNGVGYVDMWNPITVGYVEPNHTDRQNRSQILNLPPNLRPNLLPARGEAEDKRNGVGYLEPNHTDGQNRSQARAGGEAW